MRKSRKYKVRGRFDPYEPYDPEESLAPQDFEEHPYYRDYYQSYPRQPLPQRRQGVYSDQALAPGGGSGYHDPHCCPHVVWPKTLFTFLAAIPIVVFFLNGQIIMFLGRRRKRRRDFGPLTLFNQTVKSPSFFGDLLSDVLDQIKAGNESILNKHILPARWAFPLIINNNRPFVAFFRLSKNSQSNQSVLSQVQIFLL